MEKSLAFTLEFCLTLRIIYISILNGFVYLAAILDIYSPKIIGYAIGKTLSSKLVITALNMTDYSYQKYR